MKGNFGGTVDFNTIPLFSYIYGTNLVSGQAIC